MSKNFCEVFELAGRRYALIAPIAPIFGREQLLDVVELRPDDWIAPNRLHESVEVDIGDEGPFVIVTSTDAVGHPYGRQTRTAQIAVVLSVGNTAAAQLAQIDDADGRGLSGG